MRRIFLLLNVATVVLIGCTKSEKYKDWTYDNVSRDALLQKQLPTYVVGMDTSLGITQQGIVYLKIIDKEVHGAQDLVCATVHQQPYPFYLRMSIYGSTGKEIFEQYAEQENGHSVIQKKNSAQYYWMVKQSEYPLRVKLSLYSKATENKE